MVMRSFLLFPDLQNRDLVFSTTYLRPAGRGSAFPACEGGIAASSKSHPLGLDS